MTVLGTAEPKAGSPGLQPRIPTPFFVEKALVFNRGDTSVRKWERHRRQKGERRPLSFPWNTAEALVWGFLHLAVIPVAPAPRGGQVRWGGVWIWRMGAGHTPHSSSGEGPHGRHCGWWKGPLIEMPAHPWGRWAQLPVFCRWFWHPDLTPCRAVCILWDLSILICDSWQASLAWPLKEEKKKKKGISSKRQRYRVA